MGIVTSKDDIREFLIARRGNVTPAQAGIRDFGGERRVPGLRREEVAEPAGVSLDYTRLERGNIQGASEGVLNAIARALHLNDIERSHLFDLARAIVPRPAQDDRGTHRNTGVRASVQRVLDNLSAPAVVELPTRPHRRQPLGTGVALTALRYGSTEQRTFHLPGLAHGTFTWTGL